MCWLPGWLAMTAACHHGDPPPEAPSCTAAADHVRACVVATTSLRKPRHCKAMLTGDQRAALDRELAAVAATPVVNRLPAACRDCGALIERLSGCTAVSGSMRSEVQLVYRDLTLAWMRGNVDARTLEIQCRSMTNRLRRSFGMTCGW
jgi:hypothetical protein